MKMLSAEVLSVLCWKLTLLARAGVSAGERASLLLEDNEDKALSDILGQVAKHLEEGAALSAALAATGVFPDYLVRMLEIGQAAGREEQVLSDLTDYYRWEADTRGTLRRAMAYPAMMAALIAVIFSVLLSQVLPMFTRVFEQMGQQPSRLTLALLSMGDVSRYVAAALCVLLVGAAVWLIYRINRGGSLPMGKAAAALDRSRFSSAMSLMLSAGLPLDEAMERTEKLLSTSRLGEKVARCRTLMEGGAAFPGAVQESGILTGMQAGLLAAGARSGALEAAMAEVTQRSQAQADEGLSGLLSRFEFVLVLVLCVAVGLVLLAVMLPLLSVLTAIG
ncbi:MAG: type II secretion system F family protein [Oscillospiraceae bacterium]